MSSLLTLALLYLAALLIPGPNMLLLTHTAASRSRRSAFAVALGIALGTLMWVSIAVFGLRELFDALPMLQTVLKLVGGFYLLYLAVSLLRSAKSLPADSVPEAMQSHSFATNFRRGLLTNVTNPKSLAFWSSVAVVSIDPSTPFWLQVTAVALIGAMGLLWHIGVAYVFSTAPAQRAYLRAKPALSVITAAIMAAFGAKLLWTVSRHG